MSTKMEVPLQSELTECLVNARHWLLCMGADLIGDKCWDLREPQSCWRNISITNSIFYGVCSVQFSHSVMSDSLQHHGLLHARPPCPSATPEACSNSCPSSQWCHPTISSSVLFSSCLQCFPATGSFLISLFFTSFGQNWSFRFRFSEYSGFISFSIDCLELLSVQGTLKRLVQHHSSKAAILHCSPLFMVQLSHPYMTTGKIIALIILNFF